MKKKFHANGKTYEIPESEVSNFLKDFPNAEETKSYDVKGKKYDIPLSETAAFESEMGLKKKEATPPPVSTPIVAAPAQEQPIAAQPESVKPSNTPAAPSKPLDFNEVGGNFGVPQALAPGEAPMPDPAFFKSQKELTPKPDYLQSFQDQEAQKQQQGKFVTMPDGKGGNAKKFISFKTLPNNIEPDFVEGLQKRIKSGVITDFDANVIAKNEIPDLTDNRYTPSDDSKLNDYLRDFKLPKGEDAASNIQNINTILSKIQNNPEDVYQDDSGFGSSYLSQNQMNSIAQLNAIKYKLAKQELKSKATIDVPIDASQREENDGNNLKAAFRHLLNMGSNPTGDVGQAIMGSEFSENRIQLKNEFWKGMEFYRTYDPVLYDRVYNQVKNKLPMSQTQIATIESMGVKLKKEEADEDLLSDKITVGQHAGIVGELYKSSIENTYKHPEVLRASLAGDIAEAGEKEAIAKGEDPDKTWSYPDDFIAKAGRESAISRGLDPDSQGIKDAITYLQKNEGVLPMQNSIAKRNKTRDLFEGLAEPIRGVANLLDPKTGNSAYIQSQSAGSTMVADSDLDSEKAGYLKYRKGIIKGAGQFATQAALAYVGSSFLGSIGGALKIAAPVAEEAGAALAGEEVAAANAIVAPVDASLSGSIKFGKNFFPKARDFASTMITSYAQVYDSNYKTAQTYTANDETAANIANVQSAMEGLSENLLSPLEVARGIGKGLFKKGDLAKGLLKVFTEGNILEQKSALKQFVSSTFAGLREGGKVAANEITEEFVTQTSDLIANSIYNPESFKRRDIADEYKEVAIQTGLTMVLPALMSGLGAASSNTFSKSMLLFSAQDRQSMQDQLDGLRANNHITEKDYQEKSIIINTASHINENLPTKTDGTELSAEEKENFIFNRVSQKLIEKKLADKDKNPNYDIEEPALLAKQEFLRNANISLLNVPVETPESDTKPQVENIIPVETKPQPIANTQQVAAPALEQKDEENIPDITVSEMIDRPGIYNGQRGTFSTDGKAVIFKVMGQNKEYELGNIDEIKDSPIQSYGIENESTVVSADENDNITVRDQPFANNYSDPFQAINRDKDGNVVSVNLETPDGSKRTFRGNIAEDIAYQISLKEINKNNETRQSFEDFLNEPTIAAQIDNAAVPEVAQENATQTNEPVQREKIGIITVPVEPFAPPLAEPVAPANEVQPTTQTQSPQNVVSEVTTPPQKKFAKVDHNTFNNLVAKTGGIDMVNMAKMLMPDIPNGQRMEFFAERKRYGRWNAKRGLIIDEKGLPWGLMGILPYKEGYIQPLDTPANEIQQYSETPTQKPTLSNESTPTVDVPAPQLVTDENRKGLTSQLPAKELVQYAKVKKAEGQAAADKLLEKYLPKTETTTPATQPAPTNFIANETQYSALQRLTNGINALPEDQREAEIQRRAKEHDASYKEFIKSKGNEVTGDNLNLDRVKDFGKLTAQAMKKFMDNPAQYAGDKENFENGSRVDENGKVIAENDFVALKEKVKQLRKEKNTAEIKKINDAPTAYLNEVNSNDTQQSPIDITDENISEPPPTDDNLEDASTVPANSMTITHQSTENEREELGLPEREVQDRLANQELLAQADAEIQAGYSVKGLIRDLLNTKKVPTNLESAILTRHIATLKAAIQEGASNEQIKEYRDALTAAEKGGSEAGAALQARKIASPIDGSLADFFARDLDSNLGAPLTDLQRAATEAEFAEIEAAKKAYEEKIAALEAENAKLKAKKEFDAEKSKQKSTSTNSKKDYKGERKSIIEHMKQKLKEANQQTYASLPYLPQLIAVAPDVAKLVKSYVQEGVTNLAEVITNIKGILEEDIPDITEKDVNDLIAGEYNAKPKVKSDVAKQVFELKLQAALQNKLEALLSGPIPKIEKNKIRYNQQVEALRNKIDNLQKEYDKAQREANKPTVTQVQKGLADSMAKDLQEAKNKNAAISKEDQLSTIAEDASKLLRSFANDVTISLDEAVDKIFAALNGKISGLTKEDVSNVIAGKYNKGANVQSEQSKRVKEIRMEAQLKNKLNDLLKGPKPKTLQAKPVYNQKVTALKKQIDDLQKQHAKEARLANAKTPEEIALQSLKTRTKSQIAELEKELASGNLIEAPVKKVPTKLDKEAIDLKDKLIKLKMDREVRLIKQEAAQRSTIKKVGDFSLAVLGAPRSILSSMDFSAPLRQGLIPTIAHPVVAVNAFAEMFRQAFSQKRFDRWFNDVREAPDFKTMEDSGLYVGNPLDPRMSAREEAFMSNLAEKIPLIGRLIKGSERAYVSYLNKMRVDLFRNTVAQYESAGMTFENSERLYKGTASWINNSTGRGTLSKPLQTAAPVLNSIFFSPRLIAARVNALNLVYYAKLPAKVRYAALFDMLKFVGFGVSVLALLKAAHGCPPGCKVCKNCFRVELDPRSTDFGKLRDGNKRYDIWGGFQPLIRALVQFSSGQTKSTTDGKIVTLGENEKGKKTPFGKTRGSVVASFFRSKLAPVPGSIWNLIEGKTVVGEPSTPLLELKRNAMPLIVADMQELFKDEGAKAIFTSLLPATFGVGVQNYETKPKKSK